MNPLYSQFGNQNNGIIQQFQRFMQEMKGINPNEKIKELVSSGKVSQQQLNAAQQQAQQMQGLFKSVFKQ